MFKRLTLFLLLPLILFASDPIAKWRDDFIQKYGNFGQTKDGRTFYYGEAVVNVSPLDPAFVKELVVGYEKAMLDMQASFILQTFGHESVKRVYEVLEDDSTNAQKFPPIKKAEQLASEGKISSIFSKLLDVIENDLDKKLVEQGVPQEKIKKATLEQKKKLFMDNFAVNIAKKATQNMQGLVPFKVKYATIENQVGSTTKIAVIAVTSDKTIQFAKDIARKRETNVRGKPKKLKDILPKDTEGFMREIGLRYSYDEKGRPMLISYGLWSVTLKTKNASRYQKKLDLAKRKARLRAESYIGDFIKTRISASESQEVKSLNEEIAKKMTTIYQDENEVEKSIDEIKDTIDKYSKKFISNSSFSLQGTSEVYSWDKVDENNLVYVGSVVTWSYAQLENVKNYINKPKKEIKKEIKKQKSKAVKIERESKEINSVEDF
jgi:hypothetical protein